jgi:hypothetical protein
MKFRDGYEVVKVKMWSPTDATRLSFPGGRVVGKRLRL